MLRPLILLGSLVLSSAIALAQGTVSGHPPANIQPNANGVSSDSNTQGTVPSNDQCSAARTPSDASSGNAAAEGRANGRALKPERSKNTAAGTAAGNTPAIDKNANGPENGNPANPRTVNAIAQPKLSNTMPWLWSGLGIVVALVLIGALMSRIRSPESDERQNRTVVTIHDRDRARRDDQIRRAG